MQHHSAGLPNSGEYESFRSSVALKKVAVDDKHPDKVSQAAATRAHVACPREKQLLLLLLQVWQLFDCGPRGVTCPVVLLPPVSGTADCYYLQLMALSAKGYRVIAVGAHNGESATRLTAMCILFPQAESPPYWSVEEWCEGFRKLLTHLDLEKVLSTEP